MKLRLNKDTGYRIRIQLLLNVIIKYNDIIAIKTKLLGTNFVSISDASGKLHV